MRYRISTFVVLALTLASIPLSTAQTPPRLPTPQLQIPGFDYRAETRAPARRQGTVSAGGVNWSCGVSACTTRRPWANPAVENCRALAMEVGAISSFGRAGAMLSAAQLAQCNASPSLQQPNVRVTPPPVITQLPAPSSGPVTITAPELSFVGGVIVTPPPPATSAVTLTTPELSFVGGATTGVATSATPVTINTPELSFVGR
jgi:hypothetical protein